MKLITREAIQCYYYLVVESDHNKNTEAIRLPGDTTIGVRGKDTVCLITTKKVPDNASYNNSSNNQSNDSTNKSSNHC